MTHQKNEKSLISYAVIANALQILLCLLVYVLHLFNLTTFTSVQIVLIFLELLLWFICSIMFGLGMNITKIKDAFVYGIVALLPIILLTAMSAGIGYFVKGGAGWAGFFFIGSAVNFWMRPAIVLSHVISNSAYLIYAIHLLVLFMICMIGVNFTISLNRSRNKKMKLTRGKPKRVLKEESSAPAAPTPEKQALHEEATPQDNGSGNISAEASGNADAIESETNQVPSK